MRRSLSIIIPAYNEERRLPSTLRAIGEYLRRTSWEFTEILVIDDGSRDATQDVARKHGAQILANPGNRGKGYAVRNGMLKARGEWALLTDADLSSPIEELEKLWTVAEKEQADVAFGSRAVDRSLIGVRQPWFRENIGRVFNFAMRLITGLPYKDTQCGFKLFAVPAAQQIFSRQRLDGFGFDVEVLYIARKLGYRCREVPVRWNNVEGTRVSLWTGLAAFTDPMKVRWNGLSGKYR